jgi:hypothetical protein
MVPIDTMAVAHSEQVEAQLAENVGHQNVRILILFLGVPGNMANAGGEREFSDAIEPLVNLSRQKMLLSLDRVRRPVGAWSNLELPIFEYIWVKFAEF